MELRSFDVIKYKYLIKMLFEVSVSIMIVSLLRNFQMLTEASVAVIFYSMKSYFHYTILSSLKQLTFHKPSHERSL